MTRPDRGTAKRRRQGMPAATATAMSRARKDLQHLGSPPTACSDHRPAMSQRCSSTMRVRPAAGGSSAPCRCRLGLGRRRRAGLQEQLLVDVAGLALGRDREQFAGDGHQRARVALGVIGERGDQFRGHQLDGAGLLRRRRSASCPADRGAPARGRSARRREAEANFQPA